MEIYADYPNWEWTAVLRSKKLLFDCVLNEEQQPFIY